MASVNGDSPTSCAIKSINRGKKRKINFDKWKKEECKRLKNSGKEYTTYKNQLVPENMAPNMERCCSCPFQGCKIISFEEKLKFFNDFYGMTYNEQTTFIASCIELDTPNRRRVEESVSKRHCSITYSIVVQGKRMRVCKKMICSVLSVTPRRVQMVIEKIKSGDSLNDMRGKHTNRPRKVCDTEVEQIMQHISSFPCQESHYSRKSNKKFCLDSNLSIRKMYQLFQEKHPNTKIKCHKYREIFNEKFNLRFGIPRSDTCKTCDKYFIQLAAAETEVDRKRIECETELHHRKAESAYSCLSKDISTSKNNANCVVLCVDLQQVIFTPNLTHSDVFYQRQYSNYNFAIHNMGTNVATMCLWHESIAKRGSSETTSCILKYVTENFSKLKQHEERKLIIWSDRCVGQNNNWKMVTLCNYLVTQKYFSEVNQKFLVSGHSFLPCDRDFAVIERAKKSSKLYGPDDILQMIANVKPSKYFQVMLMGNEDFVNFLPMEKQLNRNPKTLKITEARWIQFTADDPTSLRVRKCHNTLQAWDFHRIIKRKKGRMAKVGESLETTDHCSLPRLYTGQLPVSKEKKADLLQMSQFLPPHYREFYENLISE